MERTVQVSGLPRGFSKQSLEDKLTIHFLRAKNGGGEIIDVAFPSETLSSALVIFEEAEVAQRVLQIENHVLAINGEQHKLKVKSANTAIQVDEVIPRVSMIINYGKLYGGRRLIKQFQKTHKEIHFGFNQKTEQCTVDGPFSAIKELSGEIHPLLSLNPDQTNVDPSETQHQQHKSQESPAISRSNGNGKGAQKSNAASNTKGDDLELQTKAGMESFVYVTDGKGTDVPHTGTLKDYTLLMDSDIYQYIRKCCKDRYQSILHIYDVEVLDVTEGGITMVYLQSAPGCLEIATSLQKAHLELSYLYQEFESMLRKEQIGKESLTHDVKVLQNIYVSIQTQYPQINFNEDASYFYLIGTSYDCSLAKKYLQDLKEELEARSQKEKVVTLGSGPVNDQANASNTSHSLQGFEDINQAVSPKTEVRRDHKLAPNFNGKVDSTFKEGSSVAKDNLVPKPEQTAEQLLTGSTKVRGPLVETRSWEMQQVPQDSASTKEAFTNADKALSIGTGQFGASNNESQTRSSKDFSMLTDQTELLRNPDKTGSDILFQGGGDSSSLCTNRGQQDKSSKGRGAVKSYHSETSAGTLFHQGDLLDTISTAKGSERQSTKTTLRKTNSFSGCSKPKRSAEAVHKFQEKPAEAAQTERVSVTEELLIDSDVWSYLKDIHDTTIREITTRNVAIVNEQLLGDTTVLKLTALNRDNVTAAKEDILSLYTLVMKHLIQHRLSYRDLGIEVCTEKTVKEWQCTLKKTFPKVKFIASQHGFHVIGTYEHCLKVMEAVKPELRCRDLEDLSWMDIGPTLASNQQALLDDEKVGGTEREIFTRSADGFSSLGRVNRPEGTNTPDFHRNGPDLNSRHEYGPFTDQKRSPKTLDEGNGFEPLPDQADYKSQKSIKQIGDVEGVKTRKTLPDKFNFATSRLTKEGQCSNKETSLHRNKVDSATQSLPTLPYATDKSALSSHQRNNGQYIAESAADSKGQMQPNYVQQQSESNETVPQESKTVRNPQQSQCRSPAIGMDALEPGESTSACYNCKKMGKSSKLGCGHLLCTECHTANQSCPVCIQNAVANKNERQRQPTMEFSVLNIGVSGYTREMTLQITYDIPDGIQQEGDPNPGEPFRGGVFKAYLPDCREGVKIFMLLQTAFEKHLIFKVVSDPGRQAYVTWNDIPHKTAVTGGKGVNGYPDTFYFRKVLSALENYGLL
ncbi:uncharacterized protein LOC144607754 [Rhinoraja longicauda]